MRRGRRGTSYLDILAATALFGIALLSSAGLLLKWQDTSEHLEQRAVAEHALANEMDQVLLNRVSLKPGTRGWLSDAAESSGLQEAVGELRVTPLGTGPLKRVVISLRWSGGEALRETLL